MSFGWSGRILRVDLSKKESTIEAIDPYTSFIGGRGINTKILYDEVGPDVGPFDPENRLIFGLGVLTGTPAPTSSRTAITTLCPNGTIGTSGFGGFVGAEIRQAGYDNIIIQGISDKPVYVYLHDDTVEFRDASKVWGKDTIEAPEIIRNEIGDPDVQVACIGSAGENLVSFACVRAGIQAASGRGGTGAIMGSKNLKAIAVRGKRGIQIAKPGEFLKVANETGKMLLDNQKPQPTSTKISYKSVDLNASPNDRGVSVFGNFEAVDWEEIGAQNFAHGGVEYYDKYYYARVGCNGCPIFRCYRICDDPETGLGTAKCYAPVMFTFRVWNREFAVMEAAGHLCNKYGLDVLSTANIIAFLMELYHRGIITEKETDGIPMKRGDKEAIITTIHKIGRQEGFGRLFRDGVLSGARKIGRDTEEFAMAVKGQEIGLHEFRGRKGTALVLAVNTKRGGGEYPHPENIWSKNKVSNEAIYPSSYENKAEMVYESTHEQMIPDLLGICKNYTVWAPKHSLEYPIKLFSLATGVETSVEELTTAAKKVQLLERAFDILHGIRKKDDTLPDRMFKTAVPGGPLKGERLEKDKFDKMIDEYYELCGWDIDGIPKEETFKNFGLSSEWGTFKERLK